MLYMALKYMHPPSHHMTPQWSLHLVLQQHTHSSFEPLANISERILSLKTIFLVTKTTCKASEIASFWVDPPFLQFHPNKVTLFPDVYFLPNVVTDFHIKQPVVLPTCFPLPTDDLEHSMHSLDIRRDLAFYVSCTASFWKAQKLFITPHSPNRGSVVTSQAISKWIVAAIWLAHVPFSVPVHSHSTRAVAVLTAFLRGVGILDFCKVATWYTTSTFASHYWLHVWAQADAAFSHMVLLSVLPWRPTTW